MYKPVVILVNPQMCENVGMAARAMMNCGVSEMRLVAPRENHLSEKAIAASSGAEKILLDAKVFSSTREAVADLNIVYASTARKRNMIKEVLSAHGAAAEIKSFEHNDDVALADKIIEIPLNPEHCSLNLSQAVLLVCYEWYKTQILAPDAQMVTNGAVFVEKEKLYRFFDFLEDKLSGCKAFQDDEKHPKMMINLKNIFLRGALTEPELNSLYGVINYLSSHH